MDRTLVLYERLEKTAPFLDQGETSTSSSFRFSRLACSEEVQKRRSSLFRSSFHQRARQLSRAMAHIITSTVVFSPSSGGSGSGSGSGRAQVKMKVKPHAMQSLEVTECIKECQAKLNELQKELDAAKNKDKRNRHSSRGRPDQAQAQVHAHYAGVLLILCAQLQDVGEVQKELLKKQLSPSRNKSLLWSSRSGRRPEPKQKQKQKQKPPTPSSFTSSSASAVHHGDDPPRQNGHDFDQDHPRQSQSQQLEAENLVLLGELQRTHESAAQVEQSLVEISHLNQVFSTQIQQQAEQLEVLYEEALDTSVNFSQGNEELSKALEYNKQGGRYLIYMIVFFTLLLLFFDWYY